MANQFLTSAQYLKKLHEIYIRPETNRAVMKKTIADHIDFLKLNQESQIFIMG